jgi:hypothetical protein
MYLLKSRRTGSMNVYTHMTNMMNSYKKLGIKYSRKESIKRIFNI